MPMRRSIVRTERQMVLLAFGTVTNAVIVGIVLLALIERPIPEVMSYLALSLASQLSGAMIALGLGGPRPAETQTVPRGTGGRQP